MSVAFTSHYTTAHTYESEISKMLKNFDRGHQYELSIMNSPTRLDLMCQLLSGWYALRLLC